MQHLLLVDGHSIAFRAFFALPPTLTDNDDQPVHAVYGFLSILFTQIAALKPALVAVVWDEGRPFREEIFADYKAGRQGIDPDVARQVARLQPVLAAMQIPQFSKAGYEADDIIATLAAQAAAQGGVETIVLSGDRDLFGIIGPTTTILYPTRAMAEAERYDAARLHMRWGIAPHQVADWKALVGDSSDNIPGVPGIGEKSATTLLQQFPTVEALYDALDEVESTRMRNALKRGHESALLSLRLATLIRDVPDIAFDRDDCHLAYDRAPVEAHFDALGFNSLRERLP